MVRNEFEVVCGRVDCIEEALARADELRDLCLLVVDEVLADDLIARPDIYRSVTPKALIALAYRNEAAARAFFDRYDPVRHGRIGFLCMSAPLEVWLSSLRLLLNQETFLPASLFYGGETMPAQPQCSMGAASAPGSGDPAEPEIDRLTARENEVLRFVSAGESNKAIARKLNITEHTVKLHMHNLCRKLGVANRTAAASCYLAAQASDDPRTQ